MSNPPKKIELSEDLQAFAEERVRAGEYASIDDVANAALRLLQQRDEQHRRVRDELREVFTEMENGTYLEPSDDEFAQAVHERARNRMAE